MSLKQLDASAQLLKKSTTLIITQRLRKTKCGMEPIPDMDDEMIEIERKEKVNTDMLNEFNDYGKYIKEQDIESGGIEIKGDESKKDESNKLVTNNIESNKLESKDIDKVTDEEFIKRCKDAVKICRKHAYIFFIFEKVSKISETAATLFALIVASYRLEIKQIVAAVIVFFLITLFDSFGDWGRLREKYARLHHLFELLALSKSETRVNDFRRYAISFGGNDLFIDSIIMDDESDNNDLK